MMETSEQPGAPPANLNGKWAIVEIFGHRSHAGRITEVSVAGTAMLQIETPTIEAQPGTERAASVRKSVYDDDLCRYVNKDVTGRYVREALPAVLSETHLYGGAAIFSIRPVTQEQAYAVHLEAQPFERERFIPDDMPALPAPPQDFDAVLADALTPEDKEASARFLGRAMEQERGFDDEDDDRDGIAEAME